jgi:hypothetical protein
VAVVTIVRQDQIRRRPFLGEALEGFLELFAGEWEEAVTELRDSNPLPGGSPQEPARATSRFALAHGVGAEDDPRNLNGSSERQKRQNETATADLEIVGVRAQAEQLEWRAASREQLKNAH